MLMEQCPGPSAQYDHTSWIPRLKLQRAGYSFHSETKFGRVRDLNTGPLNL